MAPIKQKQPTLIKSSKTVDFSGLAANWHSPFVRRREVLKFTNGTVYPGTISNADSAGVGPKNAFRLGRNVCYFVQDLITWLEARARPRPLSASDRGKA